MFFEYCIYNVKLFIYNYINLPLQFVLYHLGSLIPLYKNNTFYTVKSYTQTLANVACKQDNSNKHNELYSQFKTMIDVFEKHDIKYIVCAGTLLGIIRHQKIIPHDTDIDIMIMENQIPQILNIKGFNKVIYDGSARLTHDFTTDIDIFIMKKSYNLIIYCHTPFNWINEYFYADEINEICYKKFGPLQVACPKKYNNYLTRSFGKNYMNRLCPKFGTTLSLKNNIHKLLKTYAHMGYKTGQLSVKNKTILIRLPNWVGDTVMVYPTLIALQKSNIPFICIGHKWAKDLFSAANIQIITSSKIKNPYWVYSICLKYNVEYGILFTKSLSSILTMRLAGITTIGNSYFSSIRIPYNQSIHRVKNYFKLGQYFMNKNITLDKINSIIPLKKIYIKQTQFLINKYNINKVFIVICPYGSNPTKEWVYWKDLCNKYRKYQIIAVVSQNNYKRCKKDFPNIIIIPSNLLLAGHIMKRAKYVLTNNSGAMHLASFFGANIIGINMNQDHEPKPWYGHYIAGENGPMGRFPTLSEVLQHIC